MSSKFLAKVFEISKTCLFVASDAHKVSAISQKLQDERLQPNGPSVEFYDTSVKLL